MAAITITGTIKDASGNLASSGKIYFTPSKFFKSATPNLVSPREISGAVSGTGTFSVVVESTTDASPTDAYYRVRFIGVINSQPVTTEYGNIVVANAPSSQTLFSLLP